MSDDGKTAGEDSNSEDTKKPRARAPSAADSQIGDEYLDGEDSPLCLEYLDWCNMCCCFLCSIGKCTENPSCNNFVCKKLTLAPLTVIAAILGFAIGVGLQGARPVPMLDWKVNSITSSTGDLTDVFNATFDLSLVQTKATLNTEVAGTWDILDSATASSGGIKPLTNGETSGCETDDGEACMRQWEIVLDGSQCSDDVEPINYMYKFMTIDDMEDCNLGKYQPMPGAECPITFSMDVSITSEVECQTGFDIFIKLIKYPGDLFIRALKLMVLPLIMSTMMAVPSRLGDAAGGVRLGKRTIIYYILTSVLGAFEGLIWVNAIGPGKGIDCETCFLDDDLSSTKKSVLDAFLDLGYSAIDKNLIGAYASTNILGLVCFSFLFGFFVTKHPNKKLMLDFIVIVQDVTMMIINIIIKFTPIGMFSLVIGQIAQMKSILGVLEALGKFVGTAFIAMFLHVIIVYPLIYVLATRKNPFPHYWAILPAPMTAFATSSSAATMPVTLERNKKAGVSDRVADFCIPLGTTINMDGTAIGYPIAVIFLAQLMGKDLTGADQIVIALLATVISIGAAPVPSAGMVYLIVILEAVDIGVTGAVAFLFTVDWFVDRLETTVNVFGDSMGAGIIDFYERRDGAGLDTVKEEDSEEPEATELDDRRDSETDV